ncbi:putative bis(5 -nucleosyl)-tetraphosphatase protein [Neofusicoccum parvum UCRNP2]|uniref:Putative bis(5-nucleosyl)-tetraphosphatase protein n=1 Tax=Botryosphaeria parva (strain UCR-NP2) TaxID=1287680 RepID=R1FVD4_BOTPV|nr:putative bis(5 -nucleosyl)-tetraphosphatase protein [Neofusicoccum parvum UCRNP2]
MRSFQLEQPLPALVEAKFTAAAEKQSLTFSATDVCVIRTTSGVPFQLRYCPALAKKPAPAPAAAADDPAAPDEPPQKKFDPFEAPSDDLLVAAVPEPAEPSHLLVLNKFPVIRDHLIIATKENKPQTQLLEQDDLDATYATLAEWERAKRGPMVGGRLFAFFNSGEHSGASQPHRHLQFLPVDNMRSSPATDGWDLLVDRILKSPHSVSTGFISDTSIPFAHFASRIPPNASGPELHTIYTALHSTAVEFVRKYIASHPNTSLSLHPTADARSSISYNMALTTEAMVIAPRRRGGDVLKNADGSPLPDALVELNGTVLGGTLMVKAEDQWELLKAEPRALTELLEATGIPWEEGSRL